MASFPFRPPQFSDDVAWLPPWLQSNQLATPLTDPTQHYFHQSHLQNMDLLRGDNDKAKDSNLLSSIESRYKIFHLYLSGEENSLPTLTPSCEKVLHLNLHLSSDGMSSIVSTPLVDKPPDNNVYSEKSQPLLPGEALHVSRETSLSMDHTSINLVPSPSSEKCSGDIYDQTQCNSWNARQNIVEILNSKSSDNDDIDDAVELSIAASEALVIHELVQNGAISESLSAAAILEVALQVKQARLDWLKDSWCCSMDDGKTNDTLSDLSDAEMEDAYQDVGLSISSLDNPLHRDTSISRVRDTPMSDILLGQEKEVQSEWRRDQEINFNNSFTTEPLENNLDCDKLKDMPNEILDQEEQEKYYRNQTSDLISSTRKPQHEDDLHITQEVYGDVVLIDRPPHDVEVKSHHQDLHSDNDKVSDKSSLRFQSRWFGGWTEKEGDVYPGKGTKIIPKLFMGETSYFSESADVAPDQNSFVHKHHHCSKASETSIPLGDSSAAVKGGGLADQDVVKDSTLSSIDPLCSIVPCSISAEINNFPLATTSNDNLTVPEAVESLTADLTISLEDVPMSNGQNNESIRRKENDQLAANAVGPNPILRQRVTSLRPYSMGLLGNSTSLFERSLSGRLEIPEECTERMHERSGTNSFIDKDRMKQLPVASSANCITGRSNEETHDKLLSVEQHISCANTSDEKSPVKRPSVRSMISSSAATNNEENHEASGLGNASTRFVQDSIERIAENGAGFQVHLQDIPISPLVLCHRARRRLKAPKLPVTDFTTSNQAEDQAPGSNIIRHKSRDIPLDQKKCLDSDIPARKRVRFSELDVKFPPTKNLKKLLPSSKRRSSCRIRERADHLSQQQVTTSQEVKDRLTNCRIKGTKRTIFRGLEFLLTGFSKRKEKEIEGLLRKHGGVVLPDIPSPPPLPRGRRSLRFDAQRLPVILCTNKLQTTKFLYGCAVNAFLLKVGWAYDSIRAGSVLPPDGYVIFSNRTNRKFDQIGKSICQGDDDYIFDRVGIMLHGRHSFSSKLNGVIKHGRGHVFKSLQWLVESIERKKISVGVIVAEDENRATRHLKKCASEQKIPVVPASWIINSLLEGKLLPFKEDYRSSRLSAFKLREIPVEQECSEEI